MADPDKIRLRSPGGQVIEEVPSRVLLRIAQGYTVDQETVRTTVADREGGLTERVVAGSEFLDESAAAREQGQAVLPIVAPEQLEEARRQDFERERQAAVTADSNPLATGLRNAAGMMPGLTEAGALLGSSIRAATDPHSGGVDVEYTQTMERFQALDAEDRNAALAGQMVGLLGPALATGGASLLSRAGATGAAEAVGMLRAFGPSGVSEVIGQGAMRRLARAGAGRATSVATGLALEGAIGNAYTTFALDRMQNRPLSAEALAADATIGGLVGFGLGGAATAFRRGAQRLVRTPGGQFVNGARVVDNSAVGYQERARRIMAGEAAPEGGAIVNMLANSPIGGLDEAGQQAVRYMADPAVARVADEASSRLPEAAGRLAGQMNDLRTQASDLIGSFRRAEHIGADLFTGTEDVLRADLGVDGVLGAVGMAGRGSIQEAAEQAAEAAAKRAGRPYTPQAYGFNRVRQLLGANINGAARTAFSRVEALANQLQERARANAANAFRTAKAAEDAATANDAAEAAARAARAADDVEPSTIPPVGAGPRAGGARGMADTVFGEGAARAAVSKPADMASRYQELLRTRAQVEEAIRVATRGKANPEALEALGAVQKALDNAVYDETAWGNAARLQRSVDDAITGSGNGLQSALRGGVSMSNFLEEKARVFSPKGLARVLGTEDQAYEASLFQALSLASADLDNLASAAASRNMRGGSGMSAQASAMRRALEETRLYAEVNGMVNRALTQELRGSGLGRQLFPAARMAVGAVSGGIAGQVLGDAGLEGGILGGIAGAFLRPVSSMMRVAALGRVFQRQATRSSQAMGLVKQAISTTGRTLAAVTRPGLVFSAFNVIDNYRELREEFEDVRAELDELRNGPEALHARVTQQTQAINEVDPELAMYTQQTMIKAISYLDANMPRTAEDPLGLRKPVPPSASEMSAFVARYRAIDDPVSVLVDFATGRLRAESMEAFAYVYPELHASYASGISQAFIEAKQVPYQARLQAAMFFGVPEQTLTPTFLAAMQSNYHQTEQQARTNQAVSRRNPQSLANQAQSATDRFQGA